MSKLIGTIKHEFMEMLPPTIYFFVILHIVAIIRALMVKGTGIELETTASVALAALILGKAVLLADMLPFINRFPEKPLIWNVGWKTVMYSLVALFIHYLERLYDFWKEAPGFAAANKLLVSEINWPRFWAIQILLLTLVLMYCTLAELARAIGREKFKRAFFGPLPDNLASRSVNEG
ncbi:MULTISPECIES: hypothetical protein [Cupriavidus]|jgi:hypothetical protein|uniref:Transmembrane protein n=1 Tax=Cupriavidus metallidurans TaxID=119219 RepID=A0A482J1B3_9BURK|nr:MULTISPECIES: hypothetical protein [Cupriavidus]KWR83787.1 hypothetical protein RN01_08230 [Cupriavidus sp. SHE]QBP13349.1 hypothetical protein DDF84_027350 [Cupriavidus metallidurans]QWC91152.1 hypothetical protein KB891_27005 [Cupriavidus metallidurans]